MTQIRSRVVALQADGLLLRRLMLSLILGALLGALFARFSDLAALSALLTPKRRASLWLCLLRGALFPCLLAAAVSFRLGRLLGPLFAAKGLAASWLLCAAVSLGEPWLSAVLPPFLFETVLPLPLLLFVGAVWAGESEQERPALWLLVPLLLAALTGGLLSTLSFAIL